MQGFQNPAEQEKHLLAAQYFLIVEYYASYTERVKPGADGIILEMLPKINKKSRMAKSEISAAAFCSQRS